MKTCTTITLSVLLAALDKAKRQARPESVTWDITLTNGECLEKLEFIRDRKGEWTLANPMLVLPY